MATSWVEEGSPLDDYLNDMTEGSDVRDTTNDTDETKMQVSRNRSASAMNEDSSYSDRMIKPTTPSALDSASSFLSPPRPDIRRHLSDDGFAERFKYLICSSALLERDYVPGLGGEGVDVEDVSSLTTELGHAEVLPGSMRQIQGMRDMSEGIWSVLRTSSETLWAGCGRRWDIVGAIGVMLAGMAVIVGFGRFALGSLGMCVTVGGLSFARQGRSSQLAHAVTVEEPLDVVTSPSTDSRPEHSSSPRRPTTSPAPRQTSLTALGDLLTSSRRLDNTIEKTLSLLKPDPSDHQQLHTLRLALNRLTTDMTDNLATATSSLLELVDRAELAVLGEMYDIPVVGSFFYSRKPLSSRNSDSEDDSEPTPQMLARSVPSPKPSRLGSSLHPPTFEQSGSRPMTESRSFPGHGHFRPSHKTHHLSLSLSPRLPSSASDDRFTNLPSRTPRISKRSSWNSDTWSSSASTLAPTPDVRDVRVRRLSRPSHERRINEADEGVEEDDQSSSSGRSAGSPLLAASLPASPSPIRRITGKRSPLSGREGGLDDGSKLPSQVHLPSPFASTPNSKRRSLQNMPYNPPAEMIPTSSGLTRTRSLPFTDIQSLRSRYATGNRSRGASITSPPDYDSVPTPRIRRVVSVSPLTLPSLKAACLNIHLRRRRLACCLLGLRFDETKESYWTDVNKAMAELLERVDTERGKLDSAISEAARVSEETQSIAVQPPWTHRQVDSLDSIDFAPRTSDEAVLKERIEEIKASLTKTWADLAAVERGTGKVDDAWSLIRRDLGEMVRSWERGKPTVQRISAQRVRPSGRMTPEMSEPPDPDAVGVPDFMKAWSDEDASYPESPSTSFETDRVPESLDGQDHDDGEEDGEERTEILPPRGIDEVFEADLEGAVQARAKSGLSREERIKLVKEARTRGLTLEEMMAATAATAVAGGESGVEGGVGGGGKGGDQEVFKQG